jgi:phosphatidate cytidylyltransferase
MHAHSPMIHTRVFIGSMLAIAAAGVLVGDGYLSPWFPCLFVCLMVAGVLASRELVRLFPDAYRPSEPLVVAGVLLCLAANWYPTLQIKFGGIEASRWPLQGYAFASVLFSFIATMIAAFLLEMYRFSEPGSAVPRLGSTLLAVSYLGVLPCCFTQIRFLRTDHTGILLALTICVPKCNDIAAFFTGTFIGRHKMTPLLSPKKTWEGFLGGMLGSVMASVVLTISVPSDESPIFPGGVWEAVAFGIVVGVAGVLGDLAESLIKRDCHTKDASNNIPGFGGLLDVIDSVLFAAPIAYIWFTWHAN